MTIEEIKNTPKLVDYLLDDSLTANSRKKLHKRMDEICNLAIKALEQEPCEDAVNRKIDEWEVEGKPAELWLINGMLQIRVFGTIHNVLLPPVQPEQKVVRCKDCKHLYIDGECPLRLWKYHVEDDFCSYAEAKMEEGE